jgi:hypothetical protein
MGPTYDAQNNVMVLFMNAGTTVTPEAIEWQTGWQIEAGYSMTTGAQLWITNRTQPPGTTVVMGPAANGVYTEYDAQQLTWSGFSTLTGKQLWGPTTPYTDPLGYYDFDSAVIAYGNLYTWTFGGYVYCYNLTTGALEWSWNTGSTGENNPYGVNPLWIIDHSAATVAGGVIYVETGHNYGPPLFSGAQIYAINATTGHEIWQFLNFASTGSLPVVDGYMLSLNSYDNQIYAYGKGNTATTVNTAPAINSNTQVLISGSVTDQSPGQTCLGIPAAGTPAISDASMSAWMEYLYEQSPEPTNATGVPVTLTDIDPNGNSYVIGTTTSDITGHYSYTFTPTVPGTYTIIATFGGSNSYYSSTAETSMQFNTPTTPAPTAAPVLGLATMSALTYGIVAVIVVIIIAIAIVGLLLLRKKP